jgi:hypothetical protein
MNADHCVTPVIERRRPGDGLLAIAVAAALLGSVVTEVPARLPLRLCPFWNVLGIPCPGCGMTRGFVAMGHGQIGEAWRCNPLSPALFVAACGYLAYAVFRRVAGLRGGLHLPVRAQYALWAVILVAVAGSWTLSLVRHFSQPPAGSPPLVAQVYHWLTSG